jgi:AraC-like DNA-binding protein
VRVFADRKEALAWLSYDDGQILTELQRICDDACGTREVTRRVRDHLAADLHDASIGRAAKALALSARTLQRRLKEEGTSFQAELNAAQVRAAKRLLEESDQKLTTIAFDVGCATLQHFSDLFRRHTGEAPSAYRERLRRGKNA